MKSIYYNFLGIILIILGFIASILGCYLPEYQTFLWIALIIALIYFFGGWYLFKPYIPTGNPFLLFFIGYFYSGVFMAAAFSIARWPFAETMIKYAAPVWVLAQIVLIIAVRKKLSDKRLTQFIVEVGLLSILTIILIIKLYP